MKDLTPARSSLDPIELASRDEISALQLERLKKSLHHAYANVPFYRQSFDAAGVHPDDLNDLSNLAKFPFTVKTDLRDIDGDLPDAAYLLDLMGQDKKVIDGKLRFILARSIGDAFVTADVPRDAVLQLLDDALAERH